MPRDLMNLSSLRIVERGDEEYVPLEETPKSKSGQQKSANPMKPKDGHDDSACYYNYGINDGTGRYHESSYQFKTNSLPGAGALARWDETLSSVLHISAEDIASQITLLDLPCFKAIRPEELTTCGWNKSNKLTVAPNVVAFTKRFNQVSFWTVQEILNCDTPKARAEVVSHFIKVAKKLHELNNIHSLFSVASALRSASIYRLSKTWACVVKKDKQMFDKLTELFVDDNNWCAMRSYLKVLQLPCIPYLGLFLTDLVYIDITHPPGSPHRSTKMGPVLETVRRYQRSEYSLAPLPRVTEYLSSVRYIEELQKFVEDDQYKLSLKLESSNNSSKESLKEVTSGLSSPHRPAPASFRLHAVSAAPAATAPHTFQPTHRKCRSLGTKFRSASLPRNFHKASFGVGGIFSKCTASDGEGVSSGSASVNLLDDTLLESPNSAAAPLVDQHTSSATLEATSVAYEGLLKRKTLIKHGKKQALSSWQRYWVQLGPASLLFFSPKTFKSSRRGDFGSAPCKVAQLAGWRALRAAGDRPDTFRLHHRLQPSLYKFRACSMETAEEWVKKIEESTSQPVKPLPDNLLSFE